METWQAILVALGGNAALLAALAYLAKVLISEWVRRDGADRQIIYSKLHEKRTDAISAVYLGLLDYLSICKSFHRSAMHLEEEEIQEHLTLLGSGATEFRNIFQRNKLYLKKELCIKIESVFKDTQMPSYNYIFAYGAYSAGNITEQEHEQAWGKAYIAFTEEVPALLEKLEDEFRSLLRSDKYS